MAAKRKQMMIRLPDELVEKLEKIRAEEEPYTSLSTFIANRIERELKKKKHVNDGGDNGLGESLPRVAQK